MSWLALILFLLALALAVAAIIIATLHNGNGSGGGRGRRGHTGLGPTGSTGQTGGSPSTDDIVSELSIDAAFINEVAIALTTGGASGFIGPTGSQGGTGATGANGGTGLMGPTGAQGVAGSSTNTGATGAVGNLGATGPQGVPGTATSTGATGPIFSAGSFIPMSAGLAFNLSFATGPTEAAALGFGSANVFDLTNAGETNDALAGCSWTATDTGVVRRLRVTLPNIMSQNPVDGPVGIQGRIYVSASCGGAFVPTSILATGTIPAAPTVSTLCLSDIVTTAAVNPADRIALVVHLTSTGIVSAGMPSVGSGFAPAPSAGLNYLF